jgi:hypothetical protein
MIGLTNSYVESVLLAKTKYFRGVFSADSIPSSLYRSRNIFFSIICNLDKQNEKGSHFISIICFPTHVLYIDSFGLPCYTKDILYFMTALDRPVLYNKTQVQSFDSDFCGFYCMLFVLYFEKVMTCVHQTKIVFSTDLLSNDITCINEIKKRLT